MARLRTIESIFNVNTLFRIPDYQRGYAWQEKQLEDLWQDILNVLPDMNRKHFTGALKVNRVTKEHARNKWKDDIHFINRSGDDALLHVVDGQQRLTTIAILVWVILKDVEAEVKVFNGSSINSLRQKYIHTEILEDTPPSYYFGYEDDDPSYEHLKQVIFEHKGDKNKLIETTYTNNLDFAKKFFQTKMEEINKRYKTVAKQIKENIFRIVTQNLKFDLMDFSEEDIDINVIFETENNRGKSLTNLEKLKNRLIFLTTLFVSNNEDFDKEIALRKKITETWQIIYLFLGLNKKNRLDDDDFLKAHWTMYCRYERVGKDPYARDIFDTVYKVEKVLDKDVSYEDIEDYANSLKQSVVEWYIINNPYHAYKKINDNQDEENIFNSKIIELISIDKEEAFELDKLNRLGFRKFAPIILASRIKNLYDNDASIGVEKRIELYRTIEKYNFLLFPISHRKANTGEFYFQGLTHKLYKPENKKLVSGDVDKNVLSFDYLIDDIKEWIKDYYSAKNFADKIEEHYLATDRKTKTKTNKKEGYIIWYGLEYFLQEYELSLTSDDKCIEPKFNRHIERIFTEDYFDNQGFKWNPSYSLGNLFLSKNKFPAKLSVESRKDKMIKGSIGEKRFEEIIDIDNPVETIRKRGIELLNFLEKRWDVFISDEQKEKLLFLNEKK